MIRVLLIPSSDYLGHPFPQRHNHLFERLHDGKEFEVHVIRFNIFDKPKQKSRCIIHEIPLEFRTHSTAMYYLINVASYTNEILTIIRNESIDVVVAGNLLPPLTYKLAEKLLEKRIPFIFDLQDYYPVSATGYIARVGSTVGTMAKGLFEAITRYLIRQANIVMAPGIALAMYAKSTGARRIKIIPNGISEHFLKQYDGKNIRRKLKFNDDDIVIGYIGSIEFWLDMEPLIKAVSIAYKQGMSVKFLLIGNHLQTGYPRKVENWIRKYNIEKITTWLNFIPHEEVPKYIAAMNIGTIPFDVRNPTAYYAAPNKLWEYLSQGIMVIATPIPEILIYRKFVYVIKDVTNYLNAFKLYIDNNHTDRNRSVIKNHIARRLWNNIVKSLKIMLRDLVCRIH